MNILPLEFKIRNTMRENNKDPNKSKFEPETKIIVTTKTDKALSDN